MMSPKIRGKCIVCGADLSASLFVMENMPKAAQFMPSEEELSEDHGLSLPFSVCPRCNLAQFDCDPPDYYRDVIRVVGLSETMRELRREDYRELIGKYGLKGGRFLELGCGNGDFLKVLQEFPAEVYGIENDDVSVHAAREKLALGGEYIIRMFPEREDMEIPGAPFDCFLSFNFLEHQPDPVSMLRCAGKNLREGGIGLITVPSFEYIIEGNRYYELIRDHIGNYDADSLAYLLRFSGFDILESRRIGIGDTLRIIVRKSEDEMSGESLSMTPGLFDRARLESLRLSFFDIQRKTEEFLAELSGEGKSLALWGGGHQGFTLAATTMLGRAARYLIDSSPLKQGRFAPVSHLEIVPPDYWFEDPADVIMITAPGYIPEIEHTIRTLYGSGAVSGRAVPEICDILDLRRR